MKRDEIQSQPISFMRRDMFKMAAATTAAGAAGFAGIGSAQAQAKKEGTFCDNGAPEDCQLRNDRMQDEDIKAISALNCEYLPIAVKFLAVPPKVFGYDYPQLEGKMSLCQFVSHAQKTGKAFYIDKSNEDCMGRMVLGMVEEPPIGASGQAGYDFGVYRTQAPNSRVYYNIPTAIKGTVNYVIFSPIEQVQFNPDVIVFVCGTEKADIILRATSYISGDFWESKSSCVISCAWTYMYTWLTGKMNYFTTGTHHGMNRRKVYPSGLHLISVPYQKIDEMCKALRQMDWKLISFRPDDKDQDELRRRMRNWNNLAKMIDANASFALPENKIKK